MSGIPEIEHIRPNFTKLSVGDLWIWFSYTTPVAFRVLGERRVVRVNDWSNTTGKHLNEIDGGDKKSRISGPEFLRFLKALTMTQNQKELVEQLSKVQSISMADALIDHDRNLGYKHYTATDIHKSNLKDCFTSATGGPLPDPTE